jgi:hypothetical protein
MIYFRVMVEGRALDSVAQEYSVVPATIRATVRRVQRWLREARSWLPDESFESSLEMLRLVHLARLEHQWEQAMNAWYRSLQAEETQKISGEEVGKRKAERILQSRTGEVKYLQQAREILQEIRSLAGTATIAPPGDTNHAESLTVEQRAMALDHLLETLGERARAAAPGGADSGSEAPTESAGEVRAA